MTILETPRTPDKKPTAASSLPFDKVRPNERLRVMLVNGFIDLYVDKHPDSGKPWFFVADTSSQREFEMMRKEWIGPGMIKPPPMLFDPKHAHGDDAKVTVYMDHRWQQTRSLSAPIIGFWSYIPY